MKLTLIHEIFKSAVGFFFLFFFTELHLEHISKAFHITCWRYGLVKADHYRPIEDINLIQPLLTMPLVSVSFLSVGGANFNKMERKIWLEEAIEEHIKNNPDRDSVDIVSHFKLRADITLESLQKLIEQGKVIRRHIFGVRYGYVCVGK